MSLAQELEKAVTEFFSPTVTNARKREIETNLTNFKTQSDAWIQALGFFQQSNSQYVHWYSLAVVEEMILKVWDQRTPQEKADLKGFLVTTLQTRARAYPTFVQNKLTKVLVDVAKQEYPTGFPELFTVIMQMTETLELLPIGLNLLKTVCEEFVSSRDDVSAQRRKELGSLLMQQVPGILSLLKLVLDGQYQKLLIPLNLQGPTQSPSGFGSPAAGGYRSRSSSANRNFGSFLGVSAGVEVEKFLNTKNLDNAKKQNCTLALETLLQLFSWIPLSSHINQQLLITLFNFAALNDDRAVSLGTLAMSCINEMLSKSCVPQEFEEFLLLIFKNIFNMLQDLTDKDPNKLGSSIEDLDENYREKFTEFINLFLTQHIHRVESSINFPVLEFLEQLFNFTFMQPSIDSFRSCLETWSIFLEFLISKKASVKSSDANEIEKYRNGMVSLLRELLKKLLFRANGQDLAEINDIAEDADGATEWDSFVRDCVDIIGKVADLFPEPVLEFVYPIFEEDCKTFLYMDQFLLHQNSATAEDKTKMFCTTMDLRTELTIFGSLSELFCNNFEGTLNSIFVLLGQILAIGIYCRQHELYKQGPQIVKATMQLFATLQAYSHWLSLYLASTSEKPERLADFQALLAQIVTLLIEILSTGVPETLGMVLANYFHNLTLTVRTPFTVNVPAVQGFYTMIHTLGDRIPLSVRCICYRALSNLLVLSLPNLKDSEQGWDARGAKFLEFVGGLLAPFKSLLQYPNFVESQMYTQEAARVCVQETLKICLNLADSVKMEAKMSKTMVYEGLKDILPAISSFFPLYLNDSVLAEGFLEFFLALFESLRTQVGPKFTGETITMFLNLVGGDQLTTIVSRDVSGAAFAAKFLTLLKIIVEEPGKSMDQFVPSVISLCLNQLSPIIRSANADVVALISPPFYELVKSILLNQWKFFFPNSAVSLQASQMGSGSLVSTQTVGHLPEFVSLLEVIVNSFKTPDISSFKSNLETLHIVNEKKMLFKNGLFRQQMVNPFLETFFQVLVNKGHELLREEIINEMYSMAAEDFDGFYSQILPRLLSTITLTPDQMLKLQGNLRADRDLPSFSENISKLAADCAYFRMQNSSVAISFA